MSLVILAIVGVSTMSTGLLDGIMSAPKPRVQSVKLEMDVIESARIVASCRGESITEMVSGILRPILAEMERDEMQKRLRRTTSKGAK